VALDRFYLHQPRRGQRERSQIRMMEEIYKTASRVLAWLFSEYISSRSLIGMHLLHRHISDQNLHPPFFRGSWTWRTISAGRMGYQCKK